MRISGIIAVVEITNIYLFRFQATYKSGDVNYIVHSIYAVSVAIRQR